MSKTTIHDYEVVDFGTRKPEYVHESFVRYGYCTYGTGRTFADALDDALEQIAKITDLGALGDDELIELIKEEHANKPEENDNNADVYYVGIRYNTRH